MDLSLCEPCALLDLCVNSFFFFLLSIDLSQPRIRPPVTPW